MKRSEYRRRFAEHLGTCSYCGKYVGQRGILDHVTPRSRGGSDGRANMAYACRACDVRKGNMTPAELLAWAERVAHVAALLTGQTAGGAAE